MVVVAARVVAGDAAAVRIADIRRRSGRRSVRGPLRRLVVVDVAVVVAAALVLIPRRLLLLRRPRLQRRGVVDVVVGTPRRARWVMRR